MRGVGIGGRDGGGGKGHAGGSGADGDDDVSEEMQAGECGGAWVFIVDSRWCCMNDCVG